MGNSIKRFLIFAPKPRKYYTGTTDISGLKNRKQEPKEPVPCPCGCKMWTEDSVFYVKPCDLKCKYYLYVLEQSKKQGNQVLIQGLS